MQRDSSLEERAAPTAPLSEKRTYPWGQPAVSHAGRTRQERFERRRTAICMGVFRLTKGYSCNPAVPFNA